VRVKERMRPTLIENRIEEGRNESRLTVAGPRSGSGSGSEFQFKIPAATRTKRISNKENRMNQPNILSSLLFSSRVIVIVVFINHFT
jgi:hypothetical protein